MVSWHNPASIRQSTWSFISFLRLNRTNWIRAVHSGFRSIGKLLQNNCIGSSIRDVTPNKVKMKPVLCSNSPMNLKSQTYCSEPNTWFSRKRNKMLSEIIWKWFQVFEKNYWQRFFITHTSAVKKRSPNVIQTKELTPSIKLSNAYRILQSITVGRLYQHGNETNKEQWKFLFV